MSSKPCVPNAAVRPQHSYESTMNPDLDPVRKAGRLAQLARVALRAIETATLEARMEAVEAALRLRKDNQTQKETLR